MPSTKYLPVNVPRARVDDVRLVQGGEPQTLTAAQVERLKDGGVEVEPAGTTTKSKPAAKRSTRTSSSSSRRTGAKTSSTPSAAAETPDSATEA